MAAEFRDLIRQLVEKHPELVGSGIVSNAEQVANGLEERGYSSLRRTNAEEFSLQERAKTRKKVITFWVRNAGKGTNFTEEKFRELLHLFNETVISEFPDNTPLDCLLIPSESEIKGLPVKERLPIAEAVKKIDSKYRGDYYRVVHQVFLGFDKTSPENILGNVRDLPLETLRLFPNVGLPTAQLFQLAFGRVQN